jgi:hypothetical protein
LNLDEIGVSEWEDRKSKVMIPMDVKDCLIRYKVPKTLNYLTVLTLVAANGQAYFPVIVTSRRIPDGVSQSRHRRGKYFLIERNRKPDVDRAIFERFIRRHFIPHIMALKSIPCYSKAEAVLLTDNCSAHVTPEIFRLLDENRIKLLDLPSIQQIFSKPSISPSSVFLK